MAAQQNSGRSASRQARGSSGQPLDPGLARDLSELARTLQAETDQAALLHLIVDAAVREVDGADHAGISLITKRAVRSAAVTSELVTRVDAAQRRLDNGPCLSSLRNEVTVRSDDLHNEPRWPRFASAATELGVHSMLSVQLFVEGDNLGALNLYAEHPHAFSDIDENTGLLLASHAAIAMSRQRTISNLHVALDSRDTIGQAKGILMERFKIDPTRAFAMLVAVSQHTHRKLNDIAEQLATTGALPD